MCVKQIHLKKMYLSSLKYNLFYFLTETSTFYCKRTVLFTKAAPSIEEYPKLIGQTTKGGDTSLTSLDTALLPSGMSEELRDVRLPLMSDRTLEDSEGLR